MEDIEMSDSFPMDGVEMNGQPNDGSKQPDYVLGIDFGSEHAVATIASVKTVKPEILRNDLSLQTTPVCVSFNGKQRLFGSGALQSESTNRENTVRGIVQAIGQSVANFKKYAPWSACKAVDQDDGMMFQLNYNNSTITLRPEQMYATYLAKLSSFADKEFQAGEKAALALVIPDIFTEQQRAAVKSACFISGVNVVQLLTHSAAVCIAYGSKKPEEILDNSVTMFVDVGHAYVTVSIYKWEKKKAKHLVTKTSQELGSYAIDRAVFNELNKECKQRFGTEIAPGTKGGIRLLKLSQELKDSLSAAPETDGTCENLVDGQDARFVFSRERLEQACENIKQNLTELFRDAVNSCQEKVTACELVGGGMRAPFVKQAIADAVGEDISLSYTLDSMAALAFGAAFSAAKLFEPSGGVRRPAFDALSTIIDNIGIYDLASIMPNFSEDKLLEMRAFEEQMQNLDLELSETSRARNFLESFIFETRSAAQGGKKFGELIQKESCLKVLTEYEDWMYTEEADDAGKELYTEKFNSLKKDLEPFCSQYFEKLVNERQRKEKELEEISKRAADEIEASGGKDDHDFRKLKKPERMKKVLINKDEGNSLFKDGNYEAASLRYKRSLQHCDKFFDLSAEDKVEVDGIRHSLLLNVAMCHIKLEEWDFGLKCLNEALEINSESPKALYRRALILEQKKSFDDAKRDLEKALALEPGDKSVTRLLERINIQIKNEVLKQKKMAQKMFS